MIVIPATALVVEGQDIDLDVYVRNGTSEPVKVVRSHLRDGYSHPDVTYEYRSYRNVDGHLMPISEGPAIHGVLDQGPVPLAPGATKRYKLRWTCPKPPFDFLILSVRFDVGEFSWRGTTTLKRQQGGADRPATAPESRPEGKHKPKQESKSVPR